MFRASSCPSSGATTTAVAASGLLSELGDSSAVGCGWAGWLARPRPTALCYDPSSLQLLKKLWKILIHWKKSVFS